MTNNGRTIKTAGFVLTAFLVFAGIVGSYAVTTDRVNVLKAEGSLPARQNREAIVILQTQLTNIEKDTKAIRGLLEK